MFRQQTSRQLTKGSKTISMTLTKKQTAKWMKELGYTYTAIGEEMGFSKQYAWELVNKEQAQFLKKPGKKPKNFAPLSKYSWKEKIDFIECTKTSEQRLQEWRDNNDK